MQSYMLGLQKYWKC